LGVWRVGEGRHLDCSHMNSGARYCKHCGNCSRQAGGRWGSTFCTTRLIAKHSFRVSSPPTLSSKLAQATASHSTLTSRMQFETYRNPPLQLLLTPLFGSRLLIAKSILLIFFCDQCIRLVVGCLFGEQRAVNMDHKTLCTLFVSFVLCSSARGRSLIIISGRMNVSIFI
jgi:hypothetical protein